MLWKINALESQRSPEAPVLPLVEDLSNLGVNSWSLFVKRDSIN